METSVACIRTLSSPPSILSSPFSDQSHLEFYLHRSSSLPFPALRCRSSLSSWHPSRLRAFCESTCSPPLPPLEPAAEQNHLMNELAELKLQLKQKKKELKLQMKGEKKKLKLQVKEGKMAMRQKNPKEGKKKMKCESSSSSESSDEDCNSTSMGILRQELTLLPDCECSSTREQCQRNSRTSFEGSCAGVASAIVTEAISIEKDNQEATALRERFTNDEVRSAPPLQARQLSTASSAGRPGLSSPSLQALNRIEVCAGGKCKKAGSEQLLLALGAQIPSSSGVVAVPCKCMGKCSMAMNVKVHKEDTNPQHHSNVRVEDANLILNHHFGLGRPPTGLPSFPSQDRARVPSAMSG